MRKKIVGLGLVSIVLVAGILTLPSYAVKGGTAENEVKTLISELDAAAKEKDLGEFRKNYIKLQNKKGEQSTIEILNCIKDNSMDRQMRIELVDLLQTKNASGALDEQIVDCIKNIRIDSKIRANLIWGLSDKKDSIEVLSSIVEHNSTEIGFQALKKLAIIDRGKALKKAVLITADISKLNGRLQEVEREAFMVLGSYYKETKERDESKQQREEFLRLCKRYLTNTDELTDENEISVSTVSNALLDASKNGESDQFLLDSPVVDDTIKQMISDGIV